MSTALSTSRRHRLISSRYSASLFKLFCDFCLDTDLQLVSLRHSNVNSFGQDVMSWKHRPTFVISGMPWAYCDSIDLLPKGRRCFPHQLFCRFHKDATVAYTWCHPANTSYYGLFLQYVCYLQRGRGAVVEQNGGGIYYRGRRNCQTSWALVQKVLNLYLFLYQRSLQVSLLHCINKI